MEQPIRKRDLGWLRRISAASNAGGLYPGERSDFVPDSVSRRLRKMGLISEFVPWNHVHKTRYITTEKGERTLEDQP